MTGVASRIRELRERAGMTPAEMQGLLGMSTMEYFDLELHDEEIESVPSLAQVKRLAGFLGVTSAELVAGVTVDSQARLSYSDLAALAMEYCRSVAVTRAELEDLVGWELEQFFAGEEAMLAFYPVDFLKQLCVALQVQWERALP